MYEKNDIFALNSVSQPIASAPLASCVEIKSEPSEKPKLELDHVLPWMRGSNELPQKSSNTQEKADIGRDHHGLTPVVFHQLKDLDVKKINEIALNLNAKMNDIIQKMVQIRLYLKDSDTENREVYGPLMQEIKEYFHCVKEWIDGYPETDPVLKTQIQYRIYARMFSFNQSKPIELLFCAQNLDSDLLLACARRANLCAGEDKQRQLFLCDMHLCRELIRHQVVVHDVINLGIMHHYLPIDLDKLLDGTNHSTVLCDTEVKQAVLDVYELIPQFIDKCLPQTKNSLKVVLRSCYGIGLPGEDKLTQAPESMAYPLTIKFNPVTLSEEDVSFLYQRAGGSAHHGHTVIEQFIYNKQYLTKLTLPIEDLKPMVFQDFPPLDHPLHFEIFAKKLVGLWPQLSLNTVHMNPYSIHMYPALSECKGEARKKYTQGLKQFKAVFTSTLNEWEEGKFKLHGKKEKYNSLFTTSTDLDDAGPFPKDSYASKLLDKICDYPSVAWFKAYYADYRAGPDRTILEMDVRGANASFPKAASVSRFTLWGLKRSIMDKDVTNPTRDCVP